MNRLVGHQLPLFGLLVTWPTFLGHVRARDAISNKSCWMLRKSTVSVSFVSTVYFDPAAASPMSDRPCSPPVTQTRTANLNMNTTFICMICWDLKVCPGNMTRVLYMCVLWLRDGDGFLFEIGLLNFDSWRIQAPQMGYRPGCIVISQYTIPDFMLFR